MENPNIFAESLPKTAAGKIQKNCLRASLNRKNPKGVGPAKRERASPN